VRHASPRRNTGQTGDASRRLANYRKYQLASQQSTGKSTKISRKPTMFARELSGHRAIFHSLCHVVLFRSHCRTA
ncbi:MAG: hypothetical protein Q8K78_00020, partial [Planctomycetaceae bacterium]|nr:hypothetical protein [Planctomycetaceae bacterium]